MGALYRSELALAVQPGAPDIHCENARMVYGSFLGWRVPERFNVDGKPQLCTYAGETVDKIPTADFKKHPYGAFLRGNIKTTFYGWCYGKRGYGFATLDDGNGGMIGEKAGDEVVAGLLAAMPGLGKWERWVEGYVDEHHGIYSLGGRWCDLSTEMSSGEDWMRRWAYRRALNFPSQASAADIIGDALNRVQGCWELRALEYETCLQVHDELVMRGPEELVGEAGGLLRHHMVSATANGTRLIVPLQVSVGHGADYFEAK